jgi:diguanylate cyclase (GGDEF)-like protein
MIDIDHFKRINDTFGHPAGDRVLAMLGQIVKGTVRTEDLFARYGGEEFAVLCRGTNLDGAAALAERLREKVQAVSLDCAGGPIAVTVSIGVATWLEHPDASKKLVTDADQALYEAKRTGRNRVVVSSPP